VKREVCSETRVSAVMQALHEPWEIILVDDGSNDGSTDIIQKLAKEHKEVVPVIFARNFGHQIAVTAGMDYSQGDAVIIIDADLQDPPEVILDLIAKWKQGYQVVYAVRKGREGETWFKKETASLFYRLIHRITDVKIPLDTGDFRLLDRRVVDVMGQMREKQRFLRGMSSWVGFKQTGVEYTRAARFAGETKYPLKKMLKLAMNAATGFSYFPLQLASYCGLAVALLAIFASLIILIARCFSPFTWLWQAILLSGVFFLGGVQLLFIGVLGEYIGRIYDEVRGRPLYVVSQAPKKTNEEK
jgi:glycosyltransferase involved in cell wall biosynthesis